MQDTLVVCDIESGGLDANIHSITSIALVIWTLENPVIRYKEWFVLEDSISVCKSLIKATNIDVKTCVDFDKLKKYGRSPKQVCQEIRAFLASNSQLPPKVTLVGHNPGIYDLRFIERLFKLGDPNSWPPFSHRTVDTHAIAKFLQLQGYDMPEKITSDSLFKHFDIEPAEQDRHTAAGDAIATAKLLTKLIKLQK